MQSANLKIAGRWKQWLIPLGFCVLLLAGPLAISAESDDGGGVLRSRVYKLNHITSEQARDLFLQLNIGKSYNMLSSDVLIITSNIGSDLIKATEIINVLDQSVPVQIRSLMVVSENNPAPPLDEFFATLVTISAGTMIDAPPKGADRPAIIDVVGNELIAIGAEDVLSQIETAINDWKKEHPPVVSPDQSITVPSSEEQPKASQEESLEKAESAEPIIEQKTPEIAEPALETAAPVEIEQKTSEVKEPVSETADSVEPIVTEEPVSEAVIENGFEQSEQTSLDEVAEQVFEAPSITDTDIVSAEPTANNEEDFLSEGLLEVLADAEQKPLAAEVKVPTESTPDTITKPLPRIMPEQTDDAAKTVEPIQEIEKQDDPMKVMQALVAQAKAQEEQALAAQKEAEATAQREQGAASEVKAPQADKAAEEISTEVTLQAELALLRQKLAELEAKTLKKEEPAPAEEANLVIATETEEQEPKAESNVQISKPVQTEPQFDSQLSEKELETVIDLPQEVELEALIDLVGKQLGLNYMYDPVKLKGQKVQLKIHGGKIKVKDTYALLESALRFKGFVMTRRDQLVTILPEADISKAEPVLRSADDPIQPGDVVVSSMFKLEHIDVTSAQNMLQSRNLGTNFSPVAGTKTLIITDYAYRMDEIQRLLNMIDTPDQAKQFRYRTLSYMKPSEIVPKLQELAEQLQGVSLQISTSQATPPGGRTRTVTTRDPKTGRNVTTQVPVRTTTPATTQSAQPDAVFVDTDDRTNRILIAGKPEQIEQVNELIDALDVPQYDLKTVREYIIQNVEASEVINVINELGLASVSVDTDQTTSTYGRTTSRPPVSSRNQPRPTPQPTQTSSADVGEGEQPYVSVRPATNSLLVNATEEQHKAIELVIAHVDVVQKDQRTIRQYEIQYVDTQEIIATLEDLEIIAPQQTSRYDSYSRSRNDRDRSNRQTTNRSTQQQEISGETATPLSLPTASGGSEKEITADQPQISVLETTNSLLVYATPRQHDAIALVIAHADRQLDTSSTPYVVYALENQDPEELSEVLTQLIQETVEETQRTSSPTDKVQAGVGGRSATTTAKLPTLEEENIRVIPDVSSYSLIVYANKRNQQWISELIRELDEYRPQVLLDCTLVEITKDDAFNYSLDLIAKTYSASTVQAGSPVADTSIYGLFSKRDLADISSIGGNVTGFFNSQMIQGVLETVQTNGYGRVMSQPKILVNDNQNGVITTKTTTSIPQVSSQTTTTDGVTNTSENVTFDPYEKGVTLEILPHISKGDMLRLEITLNRTDFDEKGVFPYKGDNYQIPPDLLSTDVTTVATVPDGTTIILGGLESVDQNKSQNKVPLLGDLPLLGTLFRGIDNGDQESRLYVFVKANIIRPGDQVEGIEDINRVSKKYRDEFEEMEEKFQGLQDFPGIKPPPMHPENVLEEDAFEAEETSKSDFVIQDDWPKG